MLLLSLFCSWLLLCDSFLQTDMFNRCNSRRLRIFKITARGFTTSNKHIFPILHRGIIRKGKLSPPQTVPSHIQLPDYAMDGLPKRQENDNITPIYLEEIDKMRVAGRYAREVLDAAIFAVYNGSAKTTDDIDRIVHTETIRRNAYPSTLNYHGFPKSCCTSLNEVMCHGIPDDTLLMDGDILNIDVTVYFDGVHGDCSETILVGSKTSKPVKDLVHTTFLAWQAAINHCRPGVSYAEIGKIIDEIVTPKGYSVAREFAGHGINSLFHGPPCILHFKNRKPSLKMEKGHTFTIEPIVCLGKSTADFWGDGWTAVTIDKSPCAQFEHTLLITDNGVEVLTAKTAESPKYFWQK